MTGRQTAPMYTVSKMDLFETYEGAFRKWKKLVAAGQKAQRASTSAAAEGAEESESVPSSARESEDGNDHATAMDA